MSKVIIDKHILNVLAFFIFCCCSYFGNTAKLLGLIVLVLITLFTSSFRIKLNNYSIIQFLFLLFVLLSYSWSARDSQNLISTLYIFEMVFATTYLMIWIEKYSSNGESIVDLIKAFVFSTVILSIYIFYSLSRNFSLSFLVNARLGDSFGMNANEIGIVTALGTVFCFFLIYKERYRKIYILFMFLLMIISFLTASRKALLMIAVGVLLFKLLYDGEKRVIRNTFILLFSLIVVYYLIINIKPLYDIVGYRIETMVNRLFVDSAVTDGSIELRNYYRLYAIELFKERPFLGWGANGFLTSIRRVNSDNAAYSHCNYTELLANYGLIGFLLYYGNKVVLLFNYINKRVFKADKISLLLLLLYLLIFALDYGLVSYTNIHIQIIIVFTVQVYIDSMNNQNKFVKELT